MMLPSVEVQGETVVSVLHAAAHSGNKECFEAVLGALEKWLAPDEVLRCNRYQQVVRPSTGAEDTTDIGCRGVTQPRRESQLTLRVRYTSSSRRKNIYSCVTPLKKTILGTIIILGTNLLAVFQTRGYIAPVRPSCQKN